MESRLRDIDFLSIRHARSEGQVDPPSYLRVGDFNTPLNHPTGFEQAGKLGQFLHDFFAANPPKGGVIILSTPFLRGKQTRQGFLGQIASITIDCVIERPYLGEHRYGHISGTYGDEERARSFSAQQNAAALKGERHRLRYPGVDFDGVAGESQHEVHTRTRAILDDAKAAHEQGVRTIIINAHGTSGRAAQMNILGVASSDKAWREWQRPNNCQVDLIRNGQHLGAIYAGFDEPGRRPAASQSLPHPGKDMS